MTTDGNKGQQDGDQQNQTSANQSGTSTKTYTEEEFQKALSDRLAGAGRDAVERVRQESQAELDRLHGLIDQIEKDALPKDDPKALSLYEAKKEKERLERQVTEQERQISALSEKAGNADKVAILREADKAVEGYTNLKGEDLVNIPKENWTDFIGRVGIKEEAGSGDNQGNTKDNSGSGHKPLSIVTQGKTVNVGDLSPKDRLQVTEDKLRATQADRGKKEK